MRLAEIDLVTGNSTVVNPQNAVISGYLAGYAIGGLCFDQQSQTYIVRVQNETSGYLKLVDVSNADIIASTAISNDNYLVVKYEEFTSGQYESLESYLGRNIDKEASVHKTIKRVIRTLLFQSINCHF